MTKRNNNNPTEHQQLTNKQTNALLNPLKPYRAIAVSVFLNPNQFDSEGNAFCENMGGKKVPERIERLLSNTHTHTHTYFLPKSNHDATYQAIALMISTHKHTHRRFDC